MKKFFGYAFIIIINYLFLSLIVFSFSYISLNQNKVFNVPWVKTVQKKIYFGGLRKIWQYDQKCSQYDLNLLYKPAIGECTFSNPEFNTKINFDEHRRLNGIDDEINPEDKLIALTGDSLAMGWGVNDDQTFSYHLQESLKKKVLNLGVSSYGTVRELKKIKSHRYYDQFDTIIIQYNLNDLEENKNLIDKKIFSKKYYDEVFLSGDNEINKFNFFLKYYKKTLRLLFADIIDFIFKEANLEKHDLSIHLKHLDNVVKRNLIEKNKRIIVLFIDEPNFKILNINKFKSNNFELLILKSDKSHFFTVDDHLNSSGHKYVGAQLSKFLNR